MNKKYFYLLLCIAFYVSGIAWRISNPTTTKAIVNPVPKNAVALQHKAYITYFDTVAHYPVYVNWELTANMVNCTTHAKRKNNFAPDPLLEKYTSLAKYYAHGGYDRGHNMDALDTECDPTGDTEDECFYYSNMAPQLPALNRGDWKELETYCRTLAKKDGDITIWCGSIGHNGNLGIIWIPTYCWKVIIDRKDKHVEAYLMPNIVSVNNVTYDKYKVDIKVLEKQVGYIFN